MRTKLTLLILLLCFCQLANAQITEGSSYRHHIGIIASPTLDEVLKNNKELPVGLIYKRQNKANAAFRSTLIGTSYNNTYSSSASNVIGDTEHSSYHVQLTGGYEWQESLSNRWELYYGVESGPFYGRSTIENKTRNTGYYYSESSTKTSHENYGVMLRPFAGAAFRINRKLYVATETAIIANYYRTKQKATNRSYNSFQEQSFVDSGSNVKYKPLSNISLLLQF